MVGAQHHPDSLHGEAASFEHAARSGSCYLEGGDSYLGAENRAGLDEDSFELYLQGPKRRKSHLRKESARSHRWTYQKSRRETNHRKPDKEALPDQRDRWQKQTHRKQPHRELVQSPRR